MAMDSTGNLPNRNVERNLELLRDNTRLVAENERMSAQYAPMLDALQFIASEGQPDTRVTLRAVDTLIRLGLWTGPSRGPVARRGR